MQSQLETLASYVPGAILGRLARSPKPPASPEAERFAAAILFADISGFMALTERLARLGPSGAEELTSILNAYFGELITLITAHGGDVAKFAGDALLAVWPARERSLSEATRLAAQSALAVQASMARGGEAVEERLRRAGQSDMRLSMRVSIGAGEVWSACLGGVDRRWELLIAGAPLRQVGRVGRFAKPGDVVLSPEAWIQVRDAVTIQLIPDPSGRESAVRLEGIREPLALEASSRQALHPDAAEALRTWIPGAILSRLDAGQTGWLAELRRVTVLFVNLPGLDELLDRSIERAQAVVQLAQSIIFRFEGTVNKLSIDEKGASLLAAFGLPPLAHEDDACRGVMAALALRQELEAVGQKVAIGVTTGRAFCGSVGSLTRREYTIMGDVVNLSARLMQASGGNVLCDGPTFRAAGARVGFETLPPIPVKGKADPVPVYHPTGELRVSSRRSHGLIGRQRELEQLDQELEALVRGGPGRVTVVEGEAGIGKSRLLEELRQHAAARGLQHLLGAGDAIEKSTSYHAWRGIFAQLFGLEPTFEVEERRARVLEHLIAQPELLRLAPLLNAVLPLDLSDNAVTGQMTGTARADNIRDLLLRILQNAVAKSPMLLILEDAHWLDSASWALALYVSQRVTGMALVIATRPLGEPLQAEAARLLGGAATRRMRLEALPPEDAVAIVCQSLGVSSLPEPVRQLIRDKADGHPFFSEELAFALRDAGLIVIQDGECRLAPGVGAFSSIHLPDTVQGVITSRIDRLPVSHQLTLKVASVIGRAFSLSVLLAVHPIDADRPHLREYVQTLEELGLTPIESIEPDLTYLFRHAITQEVAYNLMSFAQRRQLHRRVAEWYERHEAEHLDLYYPVLAHHFSLAEDDLKTFEYLEKAGEQAWRTGADLEAATFFQRAVDLYDARGALAAREIGPLRRGRWERFLGDARFGLGDVAAVCAHSTNAMTLLGQRLPVSKAAWSARAVTQLMKHITHLVLPGRMVQRRADAREARIEAARAAERLAEVFYFQNDALRLVSMALLAANLASDAGRLAPASRSFAIMGMVAGLARMHRVARGYFRKAQEVSREIDDQRGLAIGLYYEGVYLSGFGRWEEVDRVTGEALEIGRRIGVNYETGVCLTIVGLSAYFSGRFELGFDYFQDLLRVARSCGNVQHEAWGLYAGAECLIPLARFDEALERLVQAKELLANQSDLLSQTLCDGLLAVTWLRKGDLDAARQAAESALSRIRRTVPNNWASLEGYARPPEVLIALWERAVEQQSPEAPHLGRLAQEASNAMKAFARLYPIGKPRSQLLEGRIFWTNGHPRRARRSWRRSLDAAREMQMPFEEGLAHLDLGRTSEPGSEAWRIHLTTALEIFTRLKCRHHMSYVTARLEEPDGRPA